MEPKPVLEVDGRRLYYMFLAGTRKIVENQARLNKINVFPVKDGDTGANMVSTLRAVIESVKPDRSYKRMLDRIAATALENARGNSGIIFAQFLYGVSNETIESPTVSLAQFAESIIQSVRYIYRAVADPVEGTMLTIVSAWADFIHANRHVCSDFNQLFISSKPILEKTLADTTAKLPVLAKANVVDAGANAFAYFIEGIIECIRTKNIRHLIKTTPQSLEVQGLVDQMADNEPIPESVTFRYCTEAIIRKLTANHSALSAILKKHGDSLVIAGAAKTSRIHIHTNHPAHLFEALKDCGTITFQKADDMLRQSQAIYDRKWNIALVTDSACDLSTDLIDRYRIHMLPINIYFGDNHFLDKITLLPDQFYERLKGNGEYPKTAQVNESAFINLYSHLAAHYDAVIAVHLTAKFSGTFFNSSQAAKKISKSHNTPIAVIDSKTVSGALGLIVLRIARAIEKGDAYDTIVRKTARWVNDTRILVSVRTLKYMVRGGRVSPLKGWVAKLLNLNPIVSMDANGNSMIVGKAFSQRSNMKAVLRHFQRASKHRAIWNYMVLHANNLPAADWYAQRMSAITAKAPASVINISPVIAANAGLGAASVAFMVD